MKFDELIRDKEILKGIASFSFDRPTAVQEAVYQRVKDGESLIVQAPTGTGKTLAYLLPLFERFRETRRESRILILAPTGELALQIGRVAQEVAEKTGIGLRSLCTTGSASIIRQKERLKEKPEIIVGTPKRVLELIKAKKIPAHLIRTAVLDEGDRLFDKDNRAVTDAVLKCLMREIQLLSVSATNPLRAEKAAKERVSRIGIVTIEEGKKIPDNIKHWFVLCSDRNKLDLLRGATGAIRTRKAIIFVNGSYELSETYRKLSFHHYAADHLGGGRKKEERKKAMQNFHRGKIKYLIASDIAARGLQFDDVDTVFHLTMPEDPLMYLHRAGRTGRSGRVGRNLSFVTERELPLVRKYEKELGIRFSEKFYYDGKLMDVPKEKK